MMLGSACPEWTEQETAVLRELWAQGLSLNAISARLPGRSRNAISSRVFRLGLPARPSPIGTIAAAQIAEGVQKQRAARLAQAANEQYAREIVRNIT